jgi:hypothetical protein
VGLNEIGPAGSRAYREFVLFFYYTGLGKTNSRFCGIYFYWSKWLFFNGLWFFGELVLRFWLLTRFRSLFGVLAKNIRVVVVGCELEANLVGAQREAAAGSWGRGSGKATA